MSKLKYLRTPYGLSRQLFTRKFDAQGRALLTRVESCDSDNACQFVYKTLDDMRHFGRGFGLEKGSRFYGGPINEFVQKHGKNIDGTDVVVQFFRDGKRVGQATD